MANQLLECSFLIPVRRDTDLSDGGEHELELWDWLTAELYNRFHGATSAPGAYRGFYKDPDTHQRVTDESFKWVVAVEDSQIDELRQLLSAVCVLFQQKCVYLSIAGHVEFVEAPKDVSS